jgi:transposase
VPALPSSVLAPLWVQIAALLPTRQVSHPLGCHRQRIADRIIFDKLIGLLAATLDAITAVGPLPAQPVVHLDAGYDYQPCRQVLADHGMAGEIAARGVPAPIQVGRRWVIERTHAWGNQYGKLRWCTERRRTVVEFWLALANAAIVCGRLVRRLPGVLAGAGR